jgi:hypothetical protein
MPKILLLGTAFVIKIFRSFGFVSLGIVSNFVLRYSNFCPTKKNHDVGPLWPSSSYRFYRWSLTERLAITDSSRLELYIEKTLALQCVISSQEARLGQIDNSTYEWTPLPGILVKKITINDLTLFQGGIIMVVINKGPS